MQPMTVLIWTAGAVQLAILAGNFVLPRILRCRENLARVSPMIREMFIVHWIYILFVVALFSAICFFYAPDLAGATALGRFLSAAIALFWLPRIPIQLLAYDRELRRQHRLGDVAITLAIAFVSIVFGAAALGVHV